MSDKSEEATPRKLRQARERGDSPVSGALSQAIGFLVALSLVPAALRSTIALESSRLARAITEGESLRPDELALDVILLAAPALAGVAAATLVAGLVQTQGIVATRKLTPDLGRLDPVKGLGGLFSWQKAGSLARSLAGAALVGLLAWRLLLQRSSLLGNTVGSTAGATQLAAELAITLAWQAGAIGLALASVDLLLVRREWLRKLRMSKDEVKREHKDSEGDPELKSARERAHQEALETASVAAVTQATVLVVNPTHLATALHYAGAEGGDGAPRVLAHGSGELARRMIEAAVRHGVPVVRNVPVARALREVPIGEEIPEALYEAVAELLQVAWADSDLPEAPPGL